MLRTLLTLAVFISLNAFAAKPDVESLSGVSAYNTKGAVTAWGGMAGSCTGDGSAVCNSCAQVPTCANGEICACNTARIYDGLVLRVNTKSGSHPLVAQAAASSTGTGTDLLGLNSGTNFIDIPWSTVCQ